MAKHGPSYTDRARVLIARNDDDAGRYARACMTRQSCPDPAEYGLEARTINITSHVEDGFIHYTARTSIDGVRKTWPLSTGPGGPYIYP